MSFADLLDFPYTGGGSSVSSPLVPGVFPVAIGGHPYLIDWLSKAYAKVSIPYLRPYFATEGDVDEKAINPEALWRRSQSSWHKGAGQRHLDRSESDRSRFWASKGVDVWTRWQLQLLPDVGLNIATATPLDLVVSNGWLYALTSSTTLVKTADFTGPTAITGTPTGMKSLTSDGANVYVAGTAGIHRGAASGTTQALWQAGTFDRVGYVKSRLMAASGNNLYNILTADALVPPATALFTHSIATWQWTGFADGDACIYAAGYAGDRSAVYRIAVKDDGTALAAPVIAGRVPTGETIRSVFAANGLVFLGTSKGVRACTASTTGDLTVGAVIQTPGPVRAFAGVGQYVWFGWENYDGLSTGLGRLDPTTFNGPAPAYASDLMYTGQGTIPSLAVLGDRLVFAVTGHGICYQLLTFVPSGSLDAGRITYDIPDDKIALFVQVAQKTTPPGATYAIALAVDDADFTDLGAHTSALDAPFSGRQLRGESFEARLTLTYGTDHTLTPTVSRVTVLSIPDVRSGMFISVPLILDDNLRAPDGSDVVQDPAAEYEFLTALRTSQELTTFQEGRQAYTAVLADFEFHPDRFTDTQALAGTFIAKLKTIDT